jgi:phage terminase small subunit
MTTDISPLKTLNARQAAFVKEYIVSGDAHQAALNAGYAEGTARVAGTQLLESPNIALQIGRAARLRLARAIPLALNTLEWLVEHSPSHKVRLDASTRLLDRAGIVPPKAEDAPSEFEAPLHEMSLSELRERVERYENELSNRARDVTPDPDTTIEESHA